MLGPVDSGPPVGYWAYIVDPDGHNLEISYGQEVGLTVEQAAVSRTRCACLHDSRPGRMGLRKWPNVPSARRAPKRMLTA